MDVQELTQPEPLNQAQHLMAQSLMRNGPMWPDHGPPEPTNEVQVASASATSPQLAMNEMMEVMDARMDEKLQTVQNQMMAVLGAVQQLVGQQTGQQPLPSSTPEPKPQAVSRPANPPPSTAVSPTPSVESPIEQPLPQTPPQLRLVTTEDHVFIQNTYNELRKFLTETDKLFKAANGFLKNTFSMVVGAENVNPETSGKQREVFKQMLAQISEPEHLLRMVRFTVNSDGIGMGRYASSQRLAGMIALSVLLLTYVAPGLYDSFEVPIGV